MSRPVFIIGAGCSRENAEYLGSLGVPCLTTWQGIDRLAEDCESFCGRPGVIGMRAANVINQKAETLYVFGARLDQSQVNYNYEKFAPHARKIVYDIDLAELEKFPDDWETHHVDLQKPFELAIAPDKDWMRWCKDLYKRFRYELEGCETKDDFVDSYVFVKQLSEVCQEGEIIIPASSGQQSCALMQAFKVKRGQRILLCNTIGAMGFEPMAIGAAIATGKRVVMISGDGGFFINIQELETVKRLDLNIKYFVFDNQGYASVTIMQDARFGLRVGADAGSGLTFPDLKKLAAVWDFPFYDLENNSQLDRLKEILAAEGASITRIKFTLDFHPAGKVMATLKDNVFVNDDLSDLSPKIADLERIMRE